MNPAYYPAIKRLVSNPDWKVYERMLDDEGERLLSLLLQSGEREIQSLRDRFVQVKEVKGAVHRLIKETEEVHKGRNK